MTDRAFDDQTALAPSRGLRKAMVAFELSVVTLSAAVAILVVATLMAGGLEGASGHAPSASMVVAGAALAWYIVVRRRVRTVR